MYRCPNFNFLFTIGFVTLKSKYQNILKYFPKDFYQSLQVLQDQLTDDHLCAILNCSDSDSANKLILDCLIDATKSEDDLLDQLDRLTDASPDLKHTISELRKGSYLMYMHTYVCTYVHYVRTYIKTDNLCSVGI